MGRGAHDDDHHSEGATEHSEGATGPRDPHVEVAITDHCPGEFARSYTIQDAAVKTAAVIKKERIHVTHLTEQCER